MSILKPRVALWCCQRSLSTLFERCVSAGGHVETFHEVYLSAYRFGTESVNESAKFETDPEFTFRNVGEMLRRNFPSKSAVFLKDMAYAAECRFEELPEEYCHTFLIRSPAKVVRSYVKLMSKCKFDEIYVAELRRKLPNSFRQQALLYEFIARGKRQRTIPVVDADDFASMPRVVLQRYCSETGLQYREEMLHWESRDSIPAEWHCSEVLRRLAARAGSYERALGSTGIEVSSRARGKIESPLSEDWLTCVEECEPFYRMMHDRRLRFDNSSS